MNDWMAAHPDALPVPVRPFTPVDVVAWHRKLLMLADVGIARADGNTPVGGKHPGVEPGKSNS